MLAAILGGLALAGWLGLAAAGRYNVWRGYDSLAHGLAGYAIGTIAAVPALAWTGASLATAPVAALAIAVGAALAVSTLATLVWEWFEFEMSIHPWRPHVSLARAWADTEADAAWVALCATLAADVVVILG